MSFHKYKIQMTLTF